MNNTGDDLLSQYFIVVMAVATLFFSTSTITNASTDTRVSLDKLLEQVKQGQSNDRVTNDQRLKEFSKLKLDHVNQLNHLQREKSALEKRSESLELAFDNNQQQLTELQNKLDERLGTMKELFGVLQKVSSESQSQFADSLTQLQFPERSRFLTEFARDMGNTRQLPKMEDLERLWFELLREAMESGKVVKFEGQLLSSDGRTLSMPLTRIGQFSLIADNSYAQYVPETGQAAALMKQPESRYLDSVQWFSVDDFGQQQWPKMVAVDPTRGQLLSMLVELPGLTERLRQGGYIGWLIVALGIMALFLALERLVVLSLTFGKVKQQLNATNVNLNNPLGRLLAVYDELKTSALDIIELKLGERMLQEIPELNKRLLMIKVITVVAPLMGLLGTVTGMIFTFQSITLFGTGDPKLMAGGISQALVTTVLGLAVAIPGLLLHTLVSNKAKAVSQILEEQAAGMIAQRALNSPVD